MMNKSFDRVRIPSLEEAEAIALMGLGHLAGDENLLTAFMDLTGIGPSQLRASASDRESLAAILQFLAQDESALLAFAANNGIEPALIEPARLVLSGDVPPGRPRR